MHAAVPATLDHAGIAARVPHAGSMCLLDALLDWSPTHVHCSASSHADPANPLRTPGGLLAPNAIEYASQAMALHGGLCAEAAAPGQPPRAGYLASARGVQLHVPRLDTAPGPLAVRAERVAGDGQQAMYRFSVHDANGRLLVDGRATVVLDGVPG
jgi:predicted hotdog family 3-hydroxylacyl-ACP dehydratase